MTLKDYCEKEGKQYLLDEWDEEKNLPFTPETVSSGSSKESSASSSGRITSES